MLNPAHKTALLTRNSQGDAQIFLLSDSEPGSLATTLFGERGLSYDGIAYVRFDPAPLAGRSAPWQKGDILVSRTQSRLGAASRAILRLRPVTQRRISGYAADIIFSASGSGIEGLALDPHGRLYAGCRDEGKIFRYEPDGRGGVRETAWTTVPSTLAWNGNIGLSPDGMLFTSTGEGNGAGKLFKFSIGGDPRPFPQIQPIAYHTAFETSGELGGFSFYDNDTVLFTDGRDAYFHREIDPTLDPTAPPSGDGQPQLPGPIIPSLGYSDPAIQGLEVVDIAVMRNAWQTYLSQQDTVRGFITWSPAPGESISYDDWRDDTRCADLERRLHRMFSWIAAREAAPLAYRFQIDPETGNPRIGPAMIPSNEGEYQDGDPGYISPSDSRYTVSRDSAVDDYLAHVGHCLWVQVHNLVPWDLHEHPDYGIASLLGSWTLYEPIGGPESYYRLNHQSVVSARPSDPVEGFDFLTGTNPALRGGDSFVRPTVTETIVAFTKWVQTYLTHGYSPTPEQALLIYGYSGVAPVATMYRAMHDPFHSQAGTKHWSWRGCQTAAGLMIHLTRLLLIPSSRLKLYEWVRPGAEAYHGGVKFPTAGLGCYHVDSFYAIAALQDRRLDPLQIYNGGPDQTYSDYIFRYQVLDPNNQSDIVHKATDYYMEEGRIALRNRAFEMQKRYWQGRIEELNVAPRQRQYNDLRYLLFNNHHLPGHEVNSLLFEHIDEYEGFIEDFLQRHSSQLPRKGSPEYIESVALDLFVTLYDRP